MPVRTSIFLSLLALCCTTTAFGHGFALTLEGNKIVAISDDSPTLPSNLFDANFSQPSPGTFPTAYRSTSGAPQASTGFNVDPASPPVDSFRFDFLGGLWYSSGADAVAADAAVRLNASSAAISEGVDLFGNSQGVGGFALAGASSHEIVWQLIGSSDSLNDVPAGAYGALYQVSGTTGAGVELVPSEPLLVVFKTPDFTDAEAFAAARHAIYASVVPEPGALSLTLALVACGLPIAVRRKYLSHK